MAWGCGFLVTNYNTRRVQAVESDNREPFLHFTAFGSELLSHISNPGVEEAQGWPARSLRWYMLGGGSLRGGINLGVARPYSIGSASISIYQVGNRTIAFIPIWPGFALNTFFYATLLWLLIPGPFALRRLIRRRRGLCPKCAYPMGGSAVCTECGRELPQRVTVVT